MLAAAAPAAAEDAERLRERCAEFAEQGHCTHNPSFMSTSCQGYCVLPPDEADAAARATLLVQQRGSSEAAAGGGDIAGGAVAEVAMEAERSIGLGPATVAAIRQHRKENRPLLIQLDVADWAEPALAELKTARRWIDKKAVLLSRSAELVFSGGNGKGASLTVGEFVDGPRFREVLSENTEPPYVFQRQMFSEEELRRLFPGFRAGGPKKGEKQHDPVALEGASLPDAAVALEELKFGDHIVMLGAAGSGASIHEHGEAVSGLLFGRKHWVLWENKNTPLGGNPSDHYISNWFRTVRLVEPPGRRYEVVQNPGELLYIPDGYYHGVLNTEDSFSIAFQRNGPRHPPDEAIHSIRTVYKSWEAGQARERNLREAFEAGCTEAASILAVEIGSDTGRLAEAAGWAQRAIARDPYYFTAHAVYGELVAKAGEPRRGLAHMEETRRGLGNYSLGLRLEATKLMLRHPAAFEPGEKENRIAGAVAELSPIASSDFTDGFRWAAPVFSGFYQAGHGKEWLYFGAQAVRPGSALVLLFAEGAGAPAAASAASQALEDAAGEALQQLIPRLKAQGRVVTPVRAEGSYGREWAKDLLRVTPADFPILAVLHFGESEASDRSARHRGKAKGVRKFLRRELLGAAG